MMRHTLGRNGKAAFKVRVDGDVDGKSDRAQMREQRIERHLIVGVTHGPRETGAGRREGFEPKRRERARRAGVPRIRNDETAALVKLMKDAAAIGYLGHLDLACGMRGPRLSIFALATSIASANARRSRCSVSVHVSKCRFKSPIIMATSCVTS